jgi:acetate CoA/acetoacetate CoA-transferase beta subunit
MGPTPPEGEEDENMLNAGGGYITAFPGASSFDSCKIILVLFEVDMLMLQFLVQCKWMSRVTLANWSIPGKLTPGMGGAMDLLTGAKTCCFSNGAYSKRQS